MIAATVLPSLHAFEHDLEAPSYDHSQQVVEMTKSSIACELCDFNFSSIPSLSYFEYDLHLPLKESVYSVSITQTVYLFSTNNFSLRAPPAVIV